MEDPELLAAYLDHGSEDAFAALVSRHTDLVYSAALRQVRGNVHLAREVAQLVFTALARRARELRVRATLTGWLYTSTRYAAVQVLRREGRRLRRETQAHFMHELTTPGLPAEWERVRPVLDDVMAELTDDERESILLRYFEGRAYAEIGRAFDVSENTARMRVERALDKMHGLLSRRGVTSTAGALGVVLAQQAVVAGPPGLAAALSAGALAAAPAAGSGAAAAFFGQKAYIACLGAAAILGALILGYHVVIVRELRTEVGTYQKSHDATLAMFGALQKNRAQRSAAQEARQQFIAVAAGLAPPGPAQPPTPERLGLILRVRSLLMPQQAGMLRALRLPEAIRERFEALLLDKAMNEVVALTGLAQRAAAGKAVLDETTIALVKRAATQGVDDEIEALLGPEKFQLYRDYDRTRGLRRQVEEVAAAARFSPDALGDEQINRLVNFLATHGDAAFVPGFEPATLPGGGRLDASERAALARLQAVHAARRVIIETNRDAVARGLVKLDPMTGLVLNEL